MKEQIEAIVELIAKERLFEPTELDVYLMAMNQAEGVVNPELLALLMGKLPIADQAVLKEIKRRLAESRTKQ